MTSLNLPFCLLNPSLLILSLLDIAEKNDSLSSDSNLFVFKTAVLSLVFSRKSPVILWRWICRESIMSNGTGNTSLFSKVKDFVSSYINLADFCIKGSLIYRGILYTEIIQNRLISNGFSDKINKTTHWWQIEMQSKKKWECFGVVWGFWAIKSNYSVVEKEKGLRPRVNAAQRNY